jgi:hypothetical protein
MDMAAACVGPAAKSGEWERVEEGEGLVGREAGLAGDDGAEQAGVGGEEVGIGGGV